MAIVEVCRKHGVSGASSHRSKFKYGGLELSHARRLNILEDESAKLKKLFAEAMLDNAIVPAGTQWNLLGSAIRNAVARSAGDISTFSTASANSGHADQFKC